MTRPGPQSAMAVMDLGLNQCQDASPLPPSLCHPTMRSSADLTPELAGLFVFRPFHQKQPRVARPSGSHSPKLGNFSIFRILNPSGVLKTLASLGTIFLVFFCNYFLLLP